MTMMMKALADTPRLELAIAFARTVHANQPYGKDTEGRKKSYEEGHLKVIAAILKEAGLDSEDDEIIAYLHDSIEDIEEVLRILAHDFVKAQFSDHVYQVTWAMTGIGPTRKDRNASYYIKMALYPEAANYKLADRIANVENAKADRHKHEKPARLFKMYQSEDETFTENVVKLATNQYLIDRYRRAISDE